MIESSQNKFIKQVNALKNKKERDKSGLFVLEGERLVSEINESCKVEYCLLSENYEGNFYEKNNKYNCFTVKEDIFKKISDTVNPQGVLAVCRQLSFDYNKIINKKNALFVILEEVTDPGNLGTIIRTADAAGADAVFLSKGCVDVYNSKVIRSTMGSVFHIPIIQNIDIKKLVTELNNKGVNTLAAHLRGENYPYNIDLKKSCGIIIGNEANGLSDEISNMSKTLVKIPMPGKAESMNASIACGILIYEAVRQRLYI